MFDGKFVRIRGERVNLSVRAVMAEYDKKIADLNIATNSPISEPSSGEYSYFSNIDQLNNCPKCTKKAKKCGSQESVIMFLKP